MNKRKNKIYFVLLILLAVGLACNLPASGNPTAEPKAATSQPESPTAMPTPAANNQSSTPVTLTFTEADITSMLDQQLKQMPTQILTNPQVHLQNQMVELTGHVNQGMISGDVDVKFQVLIDENGQPKIKLVSANLGSIPIPSSMVNPIISSIDLSKLTDSSGVHYKIQSLDISNGKLTVTGVAQ
jgi:uncharacterized protein YpmS